MADQRLHTVIRRLRAYAGTQGVGGLTDADLLGRFAADHDEAAFEVLLWRHGPMVLGLCRRLLRQEQDAEDAFQAAFLVLVRKARSIGKRRSVGSWLHKVAYRVALEARARVGRRAMREKQLVDLPAPESADEPAGRDLRPVLDEELDRLPEKYRAPFVLCYLEGRTNEEAARELGCPQGTVSSRLAWARQRLRTRLARRGITLAAGALASDAVPPALVASTIRGTQEAALTAQVASLAEGVMKAMFLTRLKLGAVLFLAAGALVVGTGLAAHQAATPQPPATRGKKVTGTAAHDVDQLVREEEKKSRTDLHGNSLPEHALARLGTVRLRHGGQIGQFAFSPDGKVLAAASSDNTNTVSLWDVATGLELRHIQQASWYGLAFSPNGKILATGWGAEVRRWDTATWTELPRFRLSASRTEHLTFSPDGQVLACLLREDRQNQSIIIFLNATTGQELHRLEGLKNYVSPCFAFAPDSRTWAYVDRKEKTIRLADTRAGKEVRLLEGHAAEAQTVAFSPDGKTLASTDRDETLRFWDTATGKPLPQTGKLGALVNLTCSPDGTLLAGGGYGRGPEMYDLTQGKSLPAFGPRQGGGQPVFFSPDGKLLASAYDHSLRLWETATRKPVHEITGHEREVFAVAFAPDGRTIASTGGDSGIVRRWETATGKELSPWGGIRDYIYGLAYSPDGRMLAAGTTMRGNHTIWLLEPATGKEIRKLTVPGGNAASLAFSADGQILASKDHQDLTHVWDVPTGKLLHSFREGRDSVTEVALSPDGQTIASGEYAQGVIHVWEAATGKEVRRLGGHRSGVYAVAFSPEGQTLASGGYDKTVRLWDLVTGTQLWCAEGHENWVRWVTFSPDGKTVASGGADRSVRLWEAATGKERRRFDGHRHAVRSGVFSADHRLLATGSYDTTVLVWDLAGRAGKPLAEPPSPQDLTRLWSDLASDDAARAYRAIWTLTLAPGQAVPFFQERLRPVELIDAKRLARLIADLDNEKFEVRQQATTELDGLGEQAGPALRKALAGQPAPEARRRLEQLLEKLTGPIASPHGLRALRAVEVLEHVGTPEAQRILESLAKGAPEAQLTRDAKASLERLAKRPGPDR